MRHSIALCFAAAAAGAASPAAAQAPSQISLLAPARSGSVVDQALRSLASTVERSTRGTLRVRVESTPSLRWQRLNLGDGSAGLLTREPMDTLCPAALAFRVPAVFPDAAVADRAFNAVRADIEGSCDANLTVLAWLLPGPRHLYMAEAFEARPDGRLNGALSEASARERAMLGIASEVAVTDRSLAGQRVGVASHLALLSAVDSQRYVSSTAAGMDLAVLAIPTRTFNSMTPEHQRALRSAAASTMAALGQRMRMAATSSHTRVPESPEWSAWAQASRQRARAADSIATVLQAIERQPGVLPPASTTQGAPTQTTPADPPAQTTPSQTDVSSQTAPADASVQTAPAGPARPVFELPVENLPQQVDPSSYGRAMGAMRQRVARCHQLHNSETSPIRGEWTMDLRFAPTGRLLSVRTQPSADPSAARHPAFHPCVESAFRSVMLDMRTPVEFTVQQLLRVRVP